MSILSSILHKIFDHSPSPTPAATPSTNGAPSAAPIPSPSNADVGQTSATNAAPATLGQADVEAVLSGLAAQKGGGGNWKVSIVDLLRLLDLDSSLNARKELAAELNVHAGEHGSAEQNIALSKAVWQQLAQNGGKVPDSLRS